MMSINCYFCTVLQMAVAARNAEGHGWLRPALGVMELSQGITQVLVLTQWKLSLLLAVCDLEYSSQKYVIHNPKSPVPSVKWIHLKMNAPEIGDTGVLELY